VHTGKVINIVKDAWPDRRGKEWRAGQAFLGKSGRENAGAERGVGRAQSKRRKKPG